MSLSFDRVFTVLAQFGGHLSVFVEAVASTAPDPPRLPKKELNELRDTAERARVAAEAITRSFTLIEITALDVVDMQVRLQGETARLASALRELGARVERQHFIREAFGDELVALDEAAQSVAAAVFPSAVQGLREVNVKLWEFEKLQWKRYTDILTDVVRRGSITAEQEVRIQEIADDVWQAFAEVNTLLNELASTRPSDAHGLRRRLEQAPLRLTRALDKAKDRLAQASKALSGFGPVIKASARVADDVAKLLKKMTIPVFPEHDGLEACCDFVAPDLYDRIGGVQSFALLNILSACQATTVSGKPMLEGRKVHVTHVFPDRIYLEADRSVIDDMAADRRQFDTAPASLHRFKEGSFKQKTFRTGNLQVCFASRPGNRVAIDADIDLYRHAIPHLFGEVLVNHLTGNTTDQFKVRRMLDARPVRAIGNFQLLRI
jgi:ElaB/YqjD/DUF883 family membrane-anchored ribosome-binding protein